MNKITSSTYTVVRFFVQQFLVIKGGSCMFRPRFVKALANEDTLLPTQMFPRLPARATFVADTNFVSATNVSKFAQHGNTFILCPARLRALETS